MAVPAVLAQQVRGPPQITQRVTGEALRQQTPKDRAARPRRHANCATKHLGHPADALGLFTEDPLQHLGCGALPSLKDSVPGGDLPARLDSRHHHLRIETAERGSDDLARYPTHARATTREVRLGLRPNRTVLTLDRTIEAQRDIRRVRLRGDIHPARQRLQRVAQPASLPANIQSHLIPPLIMRSCPTASASARRPARA